MSTQRERVEKGGKTGKGAGSPLAGSTIAAPGPPEHRLRPAFRPRKALAPSLPLPHVERERHFRPPCESWVGETVRIC